MLHRQLLCIPAASAQAAVQLRRTKPNICAVIPTNTTFWSESYETPAQYRFNMTFPFLFEYPENMTNERKTISTPPLATKARLPPVWEGRIQRETAL